MRECENARMKECENAGMREALYPIPSTFYLLPSNYFLLPSTKNKSHPIKMKQLFLKYLFQIFA
jgi:hypothetical protein